MVKFSRAEYRIFKSVPPGPAIHLLAIGKFTYPHPKIYAQPYHMHQGFTHPNCPFLYFLVCALFWRQPFWGETMVRGSEIGHIREQ